ncbi:uncharacterized protein MYCFIDRAFT_178864 [Pseudocercospora fijiensis CIRAD86]|uniref:Uncharacterized protein n=1 Tax=Pseudocercospora fijiensis (strain CIRAD86) TaxID=383855 RepID=M3AMV3_PSEFD|nr:uncharacterized protein MYCFIDRAFT_178864 [Pseudocercospora fijiensis CIRAD86]EME78757.1 hypothetical protein MYCFIDRAFT_178864 [Pseudocercospora fijiensis CIRAD86]
MAFLARLNIEVLKRGTYLKPNGNWSIQALFPIQTYILPRRLVPDRSPMKWYIPAIATTLTANARIYDHRMLVNILIKHSFTWKGSRRLYACLSHMDRISVTQSSLPTTKPFPQLQPTEQLQQHQRIMAATTQPISAATRVFTTPELLEAILLEVQAIECPRSWESLKDWFTPTWQARDVLLSQRVSRAFRSCISGSPEIQRRLGFRPERIQDDKRGETKQNGRVWAFDRFVWQFEGNARVHLCKKSFSDEVPYPMIWFERPRYPHVLEGAPKDSPASFLKMYPQRPARECIVVRISKWDMWMIRRAGIELFCWSAQVTVKLQPLGGLFDLAASLQKAADGIERVEEAGNWWQRNEEVARDFGMPEPSEVFDWREFFTTAQMDRAARRRAVRDLEGERCRWSMVPRISELGKSSSRSQSRIDTQPSGRDARRGLLW